MGSVAAAMSERGFMVTGSDENIYPPMSTFLEKRKITLSSGYRAENIPANADVVVIGKALKIHSLPAGASGGEQRRVRSCRHLSGSRCDQDKFSSSGEHCSAKRNDRAQWR